VTGAPTATPLTGDRSAAAARPRFSIVTAVYNVEPYLPEFIASLEAQTFDLSRLEVVAVNDGSTDGSRALLEAWCRTSRIRVTILDQPNAGAAAARNLGLDHASGEWVTFTDPDDVLDPGWFRAVDAFASRHSDVDVMATRVLMYDDARATVRNTHPRRAQFSRGSRVVDLRREPNVFTSATVAVFRRERVEELGLRFDTRIQPSFEDGHFMACFMLGLSRPAIGLVHGAKYHYRRREAATSASQTAWSHPGRYTAVFDHGYLDLVRRARDASGRLPAWVQQLIVYDVSTYLQENDLPTSKVRIAPDLLDAFHDRLATLFGSLDPAVVQAHRIRKLRPVWVDVINHAYREGRWHTERPERTRIDRQMRLQRIGYRYTGEPPTEEIRSGGRRIDPAWSKRVTHVYFGRPLMHERILWVPFDEPLELRLDGRPAKVVRRRGPAATQAEEFDREPLLDRLRSFFSRRTLRGFRTRHRHIVGDAWVRFLAGTTGLVRYRHAWVVMDRLHDADDNGERLFEYLRRERRDINAWFVIERDTPDWRRMQAAGTDRLIAHGSNEWRSLLLNADWVLSSHSDRPIVEPTDVTRVRGYKEWKFGFLQHGVIKDDLSPWLNAYQHDLFVVSTEPEYHSIADDGTSYVVTKKEVRLTGLPRFDRLLREAAAVAPDERNLVIVGPTWRSWLALPLESGTQRRDLRSGFWDSEYIRCWTDLLASPEIGAAVAARGWRLAFMPHPNLQHALEDLSLPAHVEALRFAGTDVQALYARMALLVTDYSSVAFNAAYIDRPTVYYQFDRDRVLSGGHVGRPGYFDYERDGFGPVVVDHQAAVAAVVAAIERGPEPGSPFAERIAATFPNRDGRACERVVAAVEALSRPWRAPEAGLAAPNPGAMPAGSPPAPRR
jgi:glycosyltransferase involved in cell wall biosynthesis